MTLRIAAALAATLLFAVNSAEARGSGSRGSRGSRGSARGSGSGSAHAGASAHCRSPARNVPGANACDATVAIPDDCVAAAGGGKLIKSKSRVYEATRDITVYRVYGLYPNPPGGGNRITGPWWTLTAPPRGISRDDYASNYAVCRDWNAMTQLATCKIKKGARFVFGDGQSLFTTACNPGMRIPSKYHRQWNGKTLIAPPAQYKQVCVPKAGNRLYTIQGGAKVPVYQPAAGVNLDVECTPAMVSHPPAAQFRPDPPARGSGSRGSGSRGSGSRGSGSRAARGSGSRTPRR